MTLYQRPDERVFAEGARPGEVQLFPDLSRGWGIAFEQTGGIPPMEWFNFIGKRADEAIRYLMQRGLPEWSDTEDYPEGSYIQYAGKTYRAKAENKGKIPQNSLAEWEEWGLTRAALDECFHPKDGELTWTQITEKPTTLSGYGITDAAPIADPAFIGEPTTPTPDEMDSSERVATTAFVSKKLTTVMPTGAMVFFLSRIPPQGWLQANGALLKRADYPALWAFAQTSGALMSDADWHQNYQGGFSCGDEATTFRIPDARGEFIRCWDDGRDVDHARAIGSAQEMQNAWHTHSASANSVEDHTHSAKTDTQGLHGHAVNDPGHKHGFSQGFTASATGGYAERVTPDPLAIGEGHYQETSTRGTGIWLSQAGSHSHNVSVGKAGSHSHTITVNGEGGDESRPRNIAWLAMIRY